MTGSTNQFIHFEPTNTLSKLHPKNYNNSPPISKSWVRACVIFYALKNVLKRSVHIYVIFTQQKVNNRCGANVASEQQHNQDLRRIYEREYEFSKSSLFTWMLNAFLPECIAPSTRVHCATNSTRLWHRCGEVRRFLAWIVVETG